MVFDRNWIAWKRMMFLTSATQSISLHCVLMFGRCSWVQGYILCRDTKTTTRFNENASIFKYSSFHTSVPLQLHWRFNYSTIDLQGSLKRFENRDSPKKESLLKKSCFKSPEHVGRSLASSCKQLCKSGSVCGKKWIIVSREFGGRKLTSCS